MIFSYSRPILLRRDSVKLQDIRHLFGFGKKKKSKIEALKEDRNDMQVYQEPTKLQEPHKTDNLHVKVKPADPEKRAQWMFSRAPIFYIPRRRSGYAPEYEMEWSFASLKQGFQYLKEEIPLFLKEITDLQVIKEIPYRSGELNKVFQFRSPESIEDWVTTCDNDHNEGYSSVEFKFTKEGSVLFTGNLSTQRPKDGRIQYAGYCNVRSPQKYKAFMRREFYNWITFNSIELRIRGDGRTYSLNLHSPGPWDTVSDDMFSHPLYTRGGPYWQTVQIPFSKFIFANRARIQDKQYLVPFDLIHYISLTIADNAHGPFRLEIDYIGVINNPAFKEERAYEEYKVPNFVVQN